ncbi:MAG: sulfurtransferase TusA family protein [Clostridia bacterium]|nr:sulfurtransferase TusA family protein [Clostridia bacterium]
MNKIDCFGDVCPIPLLKIQKTLKSIAVGESFMVVVDHSCVMESIDDYYKNSPHDIDIDEVLNGVWEIVITKR